MKRCGSYYFSYSEKTQKPEVMHPTLNELLNVITILILKLNNNMNFRTY